MVLRFKEEQKERQAFENGYGTYSEGTTGSSSRAGEVNGTSLSYRENGLIYDSI